MTIQADQETIIVEAFINGQNVKSLSQVAKRIRQTQLRS